MFSNLQEQLQQQKRTNITENLSSKEGVTFQVQSSFVTDKINGKGEEPLLDEGGKEIPTTANISFYPSSSSIPSVITTRVATKRSALSDVSNLVQPSQLISTTSAAIAPAKRTIEQISINSSQQHASQLAIATRPLNVLLPPKQQIYQNTNSSHLSRGPSIATDKENYNNVRPTINEQIKAIAGPLLHSQQSSADQKGQFYELPAIPLPSSISTSATVVSRLQPNSIQQASLITQKSITCAAEIVDTNEWDDLDAEDADDPFMVSHYVTEIIEYMRALETRIMPDNNYISTQKELEWNMRSMLIDWIIEIHYKLKLLPETLFIACNLVDRFLSLRAVSLAKLQLVGIAALLIASKFEEVISPSVANFVYLSDNTYDDKEILKAERYMLHVLNYNLSYPNPLTFLRRVSKADSYDIRTRTLAKYFMEIVLMDEGLLNCSPSMTAAAGIWLARKFLGRGEWNANLSHYSGYTEDKILPFATKVVEYLKKPTKYEAIFNKYSSKKFMKAALFTQEYVRTTDFSIS